MEPKENEQGRPQKKNDETAENPAPTPAKNPVHRLYDKLPFTYRQVDIAVKVLIGLFILLLIVGIITS